MGRPRPRQNPKIKTVLNSHGGQTLLPTDGCKRWSRLAGTYCNGYTDPHSQDRAVAPEKMWAPWCMDPRLRKALFNKSPIK